MNKTAIILMPHGSKNPQWTEPFHKMTENLKKELGSDAVHLAFMEIASPNLLDAAREMMKTDVRTGRVLPLFMSKGSHFHEDIPTLIAEAQAAFPELQLELLDPIGNHPLFFELMRDMIKGLHSDVPVEPPSESQTHDKRSASLSPTQDHKKGICYLTGAGPGDLGLVTLKARQVIETAEAIVYDALCNPEMLAWAPEQAERIYVGKKSGRHTVPQEEINALLVRLTSEGKRVVRLKGGDPFLFGRGGEEAEALADAKLAFEIIPGVTAALAVPAYAGIPVTHRDYNTQLTIFTGHESSSKERPTVDYAEIAKVSGVKVMLMGVTRLEAIANELMRHGASPSLPVALIQSGTTDRQKTVRGPLCDIARIVSEAGLTAPAVAVFGEVVGLRDKLDWFEPSLRQTDPCNPSQGAD